MKSEIDLRAALRAAQDRELEELEQTPENAHVFPPRFEQSVRDYVRRNPHWPAVGTDRAADTSREVHQIMEKELKARRKRWIGVAAAAAVVLLVGGLWLMPRGKQTAPAKPDAAQLHSDPDPSGSGETDLQPSDETTGWKIEKDIEPEVQAALDAGESCMFWKVDDQIPNTGTLSNWTFEPFDCTEIWPELRAAVFPDAADVKPMLHMKDDDMDVMRYYLETNGEEVTVEVQELGIRISGKLDEEAHRGYRLTQKQLLDYTEKIKVFLEERTGIELVEWDGLIDGKRPLKDYTLVLDGNPVDPNTHIPKHCSLAAMSSWGEVSLCVPIKSIARKETVQLDGSLLSDDLRETAEFAMREYPPEWTVVDVFRDCSLNYGIDPDAHTIRPILSVTGRRYVVIKQQNGEMYSEIQSLNYQFDAVSGELIGGVHGI